MEIPKLKLYSKLMRALSFDVRNLKANRAGRLAEWQCGVRHVHDTNEATCLLLGMTFFVGVLSLLTAEDKLVAVLAMIVYMALLALEAWKQLRIYIDFQERYVLTISGLVSLDIRPRKYSVSYYVTVKDIRFKIDKETLLAFRNGEPYTIYYTPRAKVIVAAEPL